jgi:hypothetical protein
MVLAENSSLGNFAVLADGAHADSFLARDLDLPGLGN